MHFLGEKLRKMCQCSLATEQLWVLNSTLFLHVNFCPSDKLFSAETCKSLVCFYIANKIFIKKVRNSSTFKEEVRNLETTLFADTY